MSAHPTEETAMKHVSTLSLVLCATVAACGGADPTPPPLDADADARPRTAVPAPLFADNGRPLLSPAALVPADTRARTRSGLYATAAQLAWQELVFAPGTVVLDLDMLGSVAAALNLAQTVQGMRGLQGLAWYVRGGGAADAAQLVNALSDAGVADVFLVR